MISKLVKLTDAVLTVSNFFAYRWIANTYFLALFYCSGQLIHCWKYYYQEIRTIQEQLEAEIAKKIKNSPAQPRPKVTGSYFKKDACKSVIRDRGVRSEGGGGGGGRRGTCPPIVLKL